MTGYVYLLGGGEIGNNETKIIDDFILSNTKIEGNIVFIGAASADNNEYFETFKKVYGDDNTIFVTSKFNNDEFSNAILKSKIVYLGGGSTELLQAQLKKWDAYKVFINALKGGTDLVGMSAGAYVLSRYYIHEENDTFKIKKGLNLIPLTTQVHSTVKKEIAAYKLLESKNKNVPFVAIAERAALAVTGLKTISIGDGYISRYDFETE